ncbi:MAG: hypothetical protein ACI9YH_000358, partial [Colwellia sp.]
SNKSSNKVDLNKAHIVTFFTNPRFTGVKIAGTYLMLLTELGDR